VLAGSVIDAVAEPNRRAILERLQRGPADVAELASGLPVTRPAVSQHLKVLLDVGLVQFDRHGTRNVYRLRPTGLQPLRQWIDDMWSTALTAFEAEAVRQHGRGRKR
jgi:DNA-binding transcriptional ArsR family regulator